MARHLGLIGFSFVAMALLIVATQATDYTVGDSLGWSIPPNDSFYSDWAGSKNFSVGDTLSFVWTGSHSVADVSKDDYDNCNTNPGNVFGSSGLRINLTETGSRNFICTVGDHCSSGQKFSIEVESSSSAGPSTQPSPPDSSAPTLSFGVLSAFVSSIAIYFFSI